MVCIITLTLYVDSTHFSPHPLLPPWSKLKCLKYLTQRKAINQVSGEKPLIRCNLSFKQKGVYEKSDSHRDEENRRSQSGMRINGCVDCVHFALQRQLTAIVSLVPGLVCFAMVVKPLFCVYTWATLLHNDC
jgi:hypothetical protein